MLEKISACSEVAPIFPAINTCERCGVESIGDSRVVHSPLCQYEDGTNTELSRDEVKRALEVLGKRGCYIEQNDDLPF